MVVVDLATILVPYMLLLPRSYGVDRLLVVGLWIGLVGCAGGSVKCRRGAVA